MRIALAEGGSLGGNPEEKKRNFKTIASDLHGNAEEIGDNWPRKIKRFIKMNGKWKDLLNRFLQGSV